MAKNRLVGNPKVQRFQLWLLRILMKLLLRVEIGNTELVPKSGPLVVVINHVGWLDPLAAVGAFPRIVVPMAKQEIFSWFFAGSMMKLYAAIPVKRGGDDTGAFKAALRILKRGGAVLLAPEGTRSRNCQLQPGKDGAVMLALRTNAAIVPVGVTGTHLVESYWKRLRRPPIRLSIGRPFQLRPAAGKQRMQRRDMEAMTHEMMGRLARQLPVEWRGVYANLDQANEIYLLPVEG
jgi:1-acyl-sn-glycerol-3-phosphate acyltransferase